MTRSRCAIYTRKSTEAGLEQDFHSLDAQREAAEAYIQSQPQEGLIITIKAVALCEMLRLSDPTTNSLELAFPCSPRRRGQTLALQIAGSDRDVRASASLKPVEFAASLGQACLAQ